MNNFHGIFSFIVSRDQEIESAATNSAVEALKLARKHCLPNLSQILEVAAVLPVTSCEAERAFSQMKLIKTDLRSTMTDERYDRYSVLQQLDIECLPYLHSMFIQ